MELISLALTLSLMGGMSSGETDIEHRCMAETVYRESRGEPIEGQIATAQVVLRRYKEQHRGQDTICGVVFDKHQFSWTKQYKLFSVPKKDLVQSYRVTYSVLYNYVKKDYSKGALFFANLKKAKYSFKKYRKVVTYGNHTFMKAPSKS